LSFVRLCHQQGKKTEQLSLENPHPLLPAILSAGV
jgi:hypothetical protein